MLSKRGFGVVLLTGAFFVGRAAHAEDPEERVEAVSIRALTLDEALTLARTRHPTLRAARARTVAAERESRVPDAQWLPRLGAMGQVIGSTTNNSTTTLLGTGAVDIPRVGATAITSSYDMQPYPSTALAVGIRQQLWDFGRVAAERAALDAAVAIERQRLSGATLDVDFAVKEAYYAVLAAAGIAEAAEAAFARAEKHRDLARANAKTGMRPPIELTRAEADAARYESGMLRARAAVHVARAGFAAAVGVEDVELGAIPPARLDGPLPELPAALAQVERAPSVLEARARWDAQRQETRRLEAQTRPTLWATAAASGRAGGAPANAGPSPWADGWLPVVPNYHAGVVLTWPLFEPTFGRRADVSREREVQASAEFDAAAQAQRARIAAAYHEAVVAREALAALARAAEAARANWDQAERRFAVGLGTSTELADAQALRAEADIQLAIAKFQMARARAALERAMAERGDRR